MLEVQYYKYSITVVFNLFHFFEYSNYSYMLNHFYIFEDFPNHFI